MLIRGLHGVALAALARLATAVNLTGYDYIVIGSGAGGGPLAARLALAGYSTLLIEAGDDMGTNVNYTVPAYNAKATEDPTMSWNFFVRHYADESRQALDFKTTYKTADGGEYTGLDPPPGSTLKGTLYPRSQALGGCTAHNALIAVYPFDADFEYIANLTGDASWSPGNVRRYFTKLEKNRYLLPGTAGHGFSGWLETERPPLSIVLEDRQLLSLLSGGAFALGNLTGSVFELATLLAGDANANSATRDKTPAFYQIPLSTNQAHRTGSREFVVAVRDAKKPDGSKAYPLDVRTNCFVTKVIFDESVTPPRATGVEFLDGQYLYRASPLSEAAPAGVPGSATASREVIIAGGAYNSPQILKLSGIGPAEELTKFGIPVVSDLPGVGANLQDHYEIAVQGHVPANWSALAGCTFGIHGEADPCLTRWEQPVLRDHGTYSSSGFGGTLFFKSSASESEDWDVFVFGGPVNFRGYFPSYDINATAEHDWFTWAILKSHPRNSAGTVTLRSADPLDVPDIVFNYFDTGSGDYAADLQALYDAVGLARDAFARQPMPVAEVLPGTDVTSQADIEAYAKDTAWGHHASCTCAIGADGDPLAVLDSSFRVRGVAGLRVVDASVYPRIPGTFTAMSTYIIAEKAAEVILAEAEG